MNWFRFTCNDEVPVPGWSKGARDMAEVKEREYKHYHRTQIAEMADWEPGFDMEGVSISAADQYAGSPKLGDKIARNPANHADKWLVAKAYFDVNFAAVASHAPSAEGSVLKELREILHRLWGKWHDGIPYDDAIKQDFSQMQRLAHKLADSPAPSAPATGKELTEVRCGKCNAIIPGGIDLGHECVSSATQSGASATQGAREFYLEWIKTSGWLGKTFKNEYLFGFAEAYAASLRSEVERLKAERKVLVNWKESAMTQLGKSEALRAVMPSKYLGWDVYEASVDFVNSLERTVSELRAREGKQNG